MGEVILSSKRCDKRLCNMAMREGSVDLQDETRSTYPPILTFRQVMLQCSEVGTSYQTDEQMSGSM